MFRFATFVLLIDFYFLQSTNETEREGHLSMLTMLKELRETIDEHISNLLEETEEEKIKKYVTNTMRGFIIDIGQKYKDCLDENCPTSSPECDSCGAEKVETLPYPHPYHHHHLRHHHQHYHRDHAHPLGGRDEGEDEAVQEQLEQPEGGGRQEGLHQVGSFFIAFYLLLSFFLFHFLLHQGGPDQLHQQDQRGVAHLAEEEGQL